MRKLSIGALAATATLALAGGAIAQVTNDVGDTTFDASVSPSKAGTKKKPKNVKLNANIAITRPGTTVEFIEVTLSSGLKFSGKGFKKCDAASLQANGPSGCSAASKAGPPGTATALIEPGNSPLNFDVYPFVEDSDTFLFRLEQQGGGVQTVVKGQITNSGRKLAIKIPLELRQPIAGLDATLTGIDQTFSGKAGKNYIVSSTKCVSKKHKVGGALVFATRANGTPPGPTESLVEDVKCSK